MEASVEFQNPISFVNLAHDSKMKYKRSTACSSPRPFVSFVFFVVHSADQYLRFIPYDRPSRRIPSTRHHTVFPARRGFEPPMLVPHHLTPTLQNKVPTDHHDGSWYHPPGIPSERGGRI